MQEISIYVPLTQNDGQPQPADRLLDAERMVLAWAGGLTKHPPADGLWLDDNGQLFVDRTQVWTVITDHTAADFVPVAERLAVLLDQYVILYTARSIDAAFVQRPAQLPLELAA